MTKVYFVNHTHWDREWYFSTEDSLVLSDQVFSEVLSELEKSPLANFCFDGQTSIIDDYLQIHPEDQSRIKKLVTNNQLFIGPWYTQTDALLPDAESIIRNLVIGINDAKQKFGQAMMVGYLPDTFGFNAQMPTLLRQVGIDNLIFWRGIDPKETGSIYFNWRGLGGEQILALNFPKGYFSGQITLEEKKKLKSFVEKLYDPTVRFEIQHSKISDVLMPSGYDQMNIIQNLPVTLKNLNSISKFQTVNSNYPEFVKLIRKNKSYLPTYSGELRTPKYARVHRTIGAIRPSLKKKNFYLEQKILKRIEPLCVIAHKVGINISNGLLNNLWKKLLSCQPHDSLGGCITDNVAEDILQRDKEVAEMADGIENLIKKRIADHLKLSDQEILIFNPEPFPFDDFKTIKVLTKNRNIRISEMTNCTLENVTFFPGRQEILAMTAEGEKYLKEADHYALTFHGKVKVPGLGYRVLHIVESPKKLKNPIRKIMDACQICSNNQVLNFNQGKINLIQGNHKLEDIISLVDEPNDGDTYDFSPRDKTLKQILPLTNAKVEIINQKQFLNIWGSVQLEAGYSGENEPGKLSYQLRLSFIDDLIYTELSLNNQLKSHRLRLCFNPQIFNARVIAQIQAGYYEEKNKVIPSDWNQHYVEKPVNIFNFDKSVSLTSSQNHFTYFGGSQKTFEFKDNRLYVDLMATTNQLGKPNLKWRPGRASGDTTEVGHIMMKTPLAQELGIQKFNFYFLVKNKSLNLARNNQIVKKLLMQTIYYQKQNYNYFINRLDNKIWETADKIKIPASLKMLEINPEFNISAIYPSLTDQNCYIIRFENLTETAVDLPKEILTRGTAVNALEEPIILKDPIIKPMNYRSFKIKY